MLKFDEEKQIASVQGALALRGRIEAIVDDICRAGFKNICWLGIGGTYASCLQAEVHMKERSTLEFFVENAAEYLTTGNRRVGEGTVVVISSVTGSTIEMVDAVKKAQADGARVLGFIDVETTELAKRMDWEIAYPANEQLKFFMVADRLMFRHGEFPEYEEYYAQLDAHLAVDLAEVEKAADAFGLAFAQKHHDDKLHYFVGAGNQYGSTYSYAMCYWEEQHWIRTKSIHSSEFFHGMLEIVDRDTPVTVFVGEDSQRPLSERVVRFLPRVCANYTVIDSRDYALPGIDERFRGNLSHLVTHAVTQRIDAHIEAINCHPMEIRRYYRRLDY
ncbi:MULTISPECIES: SIS domain-containing protein [Intestinimonas]|jgi:fructoselysine-6-phosphate deglycase|uniref:Glucosamine--fructose-6-phosphate aminotransferase n=1 Tax=Intestinimonas butyriciproducens TaxID=1297617 RepID=A0A0S2W1Y6_9FIRM|nr:SIS domain-containing protein [Intestinimonas butyriciproducens]MBS6522985.1 SIS domain-containing protein [Clostridiales bacterium]SCI84719.1 Fructosamine deglycase frlB [uncultured Clostridium sp.]ALP93345.1 Glucosamine--fructose-6-phosphate aminotransferase [Intestinimonas butyriciproducens]MBO3279014.1 SIS domain-containing protein [Intestinimonas butyriciproducens]MBU5229831.1 SIS domain-containing protein [Intestinimonas butyriciproducens]